MVRNTRVKKHEASSFNSYENMNNLSSNFSMTFDSFLTCHIIMIIITSPLLRLGKSDLILFD